VNVYRRDSAAIRGAPAIEKRCRRKIVVGQNAISTNPVHKIVGKPRFPGGTPVIFVSQVKPVKISPEYFVAMTGSYAKESASAAFDK
jgi:hypothetical protein